MIGDMDDMPTLASPNAPSPGPARSNLQLLSDPAGVDFKPYLVQVLAAVRTNWLSVRRRPEAGHRRVVGNGSIRPRGGGRHQRFLSVPAPSEYLQRR
jgi:hypothetical protein